MKTKYPDLNLNFTPFPILSTSRLVLRNLVLEDSENLFAMRTDNQVMKYLGCDNMKNEEKAREYIQKMTRDVYDNKAIEWAITLKDENQLIGKLGFWRIVIQHRRAEIGYSMFPKFFGKGIMTEAIRAVLDYGFEILNLQSVEANLDPANTKSINLLTRTGFTKEGHFKERYFHNGEFTDTASYSLLRREWAHKNVF